MLSRQTRHNLLANATALAIPALALAVPVIDGTRDAEYGLPVAVQTVNTGFGDNQSELNALYLKVEGGKLYLFASGNVESNNNKFVIFFDTKAGGQNVMRNDNPDVSFNQLNDKYGGMTHDTGFEPDYFLSMSRDRDGITGIGNIYNDFSELRTTGGGVGGYAGSIVVPASQILVNGFASGGNHRGVPRFVVGYDDSNTAGVTGAAPSAADQTAAAAVTTGYELAIDLPQIHASGNFKIFVGVNGASHDYWSNQFFPGLTAPQGNLGGDGLGNFTGTVAGVNFNSFAPTSDLWVDVAYTAPSEAAWNLAGGGDWNIGGNWTGGTAPTATDSKALLGSGAGLGARTLTVNSAVALQSLTFDSAGGYTINGSGSMAIAGAAAATPITVVSGSHTINVPVSTNGSLRVDTAVGSSLTITGDFNASEVIVDKSGDGSLGLPNLRASGLNLDGGTVKINSNGGDGGTSKVKFVNIAGGVGPTATLDINNNGFVIDYDGSSPLATVQSQIAAGRAGGTWLGQGITSSAAAANAAVTAVGYAEASALGLSSFMGQSVDADAVVFRYTRLGDANLDGITNIGDFSLLGSNFNLTGDWSKGDFNFDGNVNIGDFSLLAANFNLAAPGDGLRGSAVPEPVGLAGLAAMLLLPRRRR